MLERTRTVKARSPLQVSKLGADDDVLCDLLNSVTYNLPSRAPRCLGKFASVALRCSRSLLCTRARSTYVRTTNVDDAMERIGRPL